MRKMYWEILLASLFVVGGTFLMYRQLSSNPAFWDAQGFWNIALVICWAVVAFGYCRQGWLVRKARSAAHVSFLLPMVVFLVQCILFVKGIYYHDTSLIIGAVLVNCGVVFDLYQIARFQKK